MKISEIIELYKTPKNDKIDTSYLVFKFAFTIFAVMCGVSTWLIYMWKRRKMKQTEVVYTIWYEYIYNTGNGEYKTREKEYFPTFAEAELYFEVLKRKPEINELEFAEERRTIIKSYTKDKCAKKK